MVKRTVKILSLISCTLLFGCWRHSFADMTLNMPRGVTPISHAVYDLHMMIFWICVGIAVVVFSALFFVLFKYRKSKGAVASEFHENPVLEIIWSVIPFLILVGMAIPATKVLLKMEDTKEAELTVKITGYQWKWRYEYLDQAIDFFSNPTTPVAQINGQTPKDADYLLDVDKRVILPVNKKVRFLVTSNDVIHSWWVPDLGIKQDAIPGFIHEVWTLIEEPGLYYGRCAELCGVGHAYMPVAVEAVTEAQFEQWLADRRKEKLAARLNQIKTMTYEALMKLGESVYKEKCGACHKADGSGMPPVFPALKGSSVCVGPVERHIDIILNGVSGTAMQAFGPQLGDDEIAAVVTYERNAWGNNIGDVVQPKDVAIRRD